MVVDEFLSCVNLMADGRSGVWLYLYISEDLSIAPMSIHGHLIHSLFARFEDSRGLGVEHKWHSEKSLHK